MVGLPQVLVGDSPARFLRFLPGGARLVAVRLQRSSDFGNALRTRLHLGAFRSMLSVLLWGRSRQEGGREEQNQAVTQGHLSSLSSFVRQWQGS